MNRPQFFGIHAQPSNKFSIVLAFIPFLLVLALYFTASHIRHVENEADKLLPTASQWPAR